MVRKAHRLTRPTRAGQDVPFLGQGAHGFGARRIHGVREGMLFQQAFIPLRVTLLDRLDKA